jgi:plasmid stabilization system protein ParE
VNDPAASFWLDATAEADLVSIIEYTAAEWGKDQARDYAGQLRKCMTKLASGTAKPRKLDDIRAGLLSCRCRHHFIFALPVRGEPMRVIAILHERMDVVSRLVSRLEAL